MYFKHIAQSDVFVQVCAQMQRHAFGRKGTFYSVVLFIYISFYVVICCLVTGCCAIMLLLAAVLLICLCVLLCELFADHTSLQCMLV